MTRFFKSFYGKISAVFLVLLLLLATIQIFISMTSLLSFMNESEQELNRNLAQDLVNQFSPFLKDSLDTDGIEHAIHELMVMNPRVEIYVLNDAGKILAFFAAPKKKVKLDHVALPPIRKFLTNFDNLPILGDDPRHLDREKPFSAAPLKIGPDADGYLYVVLGSEEYDTVAKMIQGSYIIRTTVVSLGVTFVFTCFIGLILFALLTNRLHGMTEIVKRFERGEFKDRIRTRSNDEIGQLAGAFNRMADTIVANMSELKKTDRLRRELIANVSHDLRSPLASIQGYLETVLMKDAALNEEERKKYLQIIYDNSVMLSKLVSELFELSKLDAKQIQPKPETFSMAELAQDVVMKFKPEAEALRVNLVASLHEDLLLVTADIALIERALSNFIDNALQYTPENGTVRVEVKRESNKVRVTVSDTGFGISPDQLPLVFDRFYRGEKSRARTLGGTGLGLAIAKRVLDLHNSAISISSAINKGTTLSFDLCTMAVS